jgi:hypothetical protein
LSSSPDEEGIGGLITTSLSTMRDECPEAYGLICRLLASREVLMLIDGETVVLTFHPDEVQVLHQPRSPHVELRTSRQTLLDLIDARLTLDQAVWTDAMVVRGDVQEVGLFHEAWLNYVRGAVRCPSFPALLERFRLAAWSASST